MQTKQATWRALGPKLRELMPVGSELPFELQALVLRLALTDLERLHYTGIKRAVG